MLDYGRQEPGEPYRRISVGEAAAMQEAGAIVIDVRRDDEWASGHVTGALHIPVDDLLGQAETMLPTDKQLLFICAMGARSGLACEMVSALGFDSDILFNIEEGTPTWIQNNLPTEYGP